jgi:hypothetical protein
LLKHGEINPLNVFGLRETEHCPPHFQQIIFDSKVPDKQIRDWIYENLSERFWLGDLYTVDQPGSKIEIKKCAAFESHAEASFFALLLDQINTYGGLLS